MCKFQVSRVFDVSSSLEKQLDTMVVFYDFVFPSYSTAPTTTRTISCVYCLSYFRGLFLSDPSLLSILLATERHATEIPNLVPHVQLLGNLPFLFSLFHTACLGLVLFFLVLAQSCPLIHCNRNRPTAECRHSFFAYENFYSRKNFRGTIFLTIICTSASKT